MSGNSPDPSGVKPFFPTLAQLLEHEERAYIERVLRATDNHYSRAARILGIGRKTLYARRRKYGIK